MTVGYYRHNPITHVTLSPSRQGCGGGKTEEAQSGEKYKLAETHYSGSLPGSARVRFNNTKEENGKSKHDFTCATNVDMLNSVYSPCL